MKLKYKVKQMIKNNKVLYFPIKILKEFKHKKQIKLLQTRGYDINEKIRRILNDTNFKYFSMFGTLLGNIRDNGFIPHDDDIDYGIIISDYKEWNNLYTLMINNGARFKHFYMKNNSITEMTFIVDGIVIDFFNLFDYSKEKQVVYWYYRNPKKYYESNEVSTGYELISKIHNIVDKKIQNTIFYIPENYEDVLIDSFGTTWKTPIKDREKCYSECPNRFEIDDDINYVLSEKDFLAIIK